MTKMPCRVCGYLLTNDHVCNVCHTLVNIDVLAPERAWESVWESWANERVGVTHG
jgi:RNA polymerase subunit RPABC4/transcription elongation factor Spt4